MEMSLLTVKHPVVLLYSTQHILIMKEVKSVHQCMFVTNTNLSEAFFFFLNS